AVVAAIADDPEFGFLHWIEPLVARARSRLEGETIRLRAGLEHLIPEDAAKLFFAPLPAQLLWMIDRTAVLELNVAPVERRLEGETPEERFRCFVERLGRADIALELLQEYPVLARAVVERLAQWVETSRELLERLRTDWSEIRRAFFADADPGKWVALET